MPFKQKLRIPFCMRGSGEAVNHPKTKQGQCYQENGYVA